MKRVNIYIAGTTAQEHAVFRLQGDAAAVAILEGIGQRVLAAYHTEMNSLGALIAAAALGLEALTEPASIRVITDSRLLVDMMTGSMRQNGYWDLWARINRAAARHRVQWVTLSDEYETTALRIARTTSARIAEASGIETAWLNEAAALIKLARREHNRGPLADDGTEPPSTDNAKDRRDGAPSLLASLLTPDADQTIIPPVLPQPMRRTTPDTTPPQARDSATPKATDPRAQPSPLVTSLLKRRHWPLAERIARLRLSLKTLWTTARTLPEPDFHEDSETFN
jgi:ribonuclease HI